MKAIQKIHWLVLLLACTLGGCTLLEEAERRERAKNRKKLEELNAELAAIAKERAESELKFSRESKRIEEDYERARQQGEEELRRLRVEAAKKRREFEEKWKKEDQEAKEEAEKAYERANKEYEQRKKEYEQRKREHEAKFGKNWENSDPWSEKIDPDRFSVREALAILNLHEATPLDEAKKVYRKRIFQCHADKQEQNKTPGMSDDAWKQHIDGCKKKSQDINDAWAILKNRLYGQ